MTPSLSSLPGLLSIAAIVGFVYLSWKQAGGVADKQSSDAYKNLVAARDKQIEELKKQIEEQYETFRKQILEQTDSFRAEINALTAKVGELTGVIGEKNDRIKTLEETLQNRNPELAVLMNDIRNFMQNLNSYFASKASHTPA